MLFWHKVELKWRMTKGIGERHWCHWLALTFPRPKSIWEHLGYLCNLCSPRIGNGTCLLAMPRGLPTKQYLQTIRWLSCLQGSTFIRPGNREWETALKHIVERLRRDRCLKLLLNHGIPIDLQQPMSSLCDLEV